MRISDPAWRDADGEPPCYLEPELEHPLFTEAVDQALALCGDDGGPAHVKLVLEWSSAAKAAVIADDEDVVEEHSSVRALRAQALHGGAPLTLEECLRDYTEAETLTDAWRCPHCQQYQPVVKTLDMWSLPDILIVHFKRFRQQGFRGGNSTKLTNMVDFPVYGFDMSPHLAAKRSATANGDDNSDVVNEGWSPWKRTRKPSSVNDNIYDLYAVCYHHGTDLETGHYTAACKNPYDNQWYLFDDAKVVNLSSQTVDVGPLLVNNSAYILFYQRRNGIYSASSSSSSAASTSSVGSSGPDHWTSRMPRFVPPKKVVASGDTKQQQVVKEAAAQKEDIFEERRHHEEAKDSDEVERNAKEVALRNSQNALHTSNHSIRKSLEVTNKSTTPVTPHEAEPVKVFSPVISTSTQTLISDARKPLYTTSIYINSSGEVDIETRREDHSPVLSLLRVNGVKDEEEAARRRGEAWARETVYRSTAAVHRHSDGIDRTRGMGDGMRGQMSFMSPQPTKKFHMTPQSV